MSFLSSLSVIYEPLFTILSLYVDITCNLFTENTCWRFTWLYRNASHLHITFHIWGILSPAQWMKAHIWPNPLEKISRACTFGLGLFDHKKICGYCRFLAKETLVTTCFPRKSNLWSHIFVMFRLWVFSVVWFDVWLDLCFLKKLRLEQHWLQVSSKHAVWSNCDCWYKSLKAPLSNLIKSREIWKFSDVLVARILDSAT